MQRIATAVLSIGCLCVATAQPSSQGAGPHLIVIGIDGLSVDGLMRAKTPRLHELLSRSAWTLQARAVMPTLSSPNWTSMITGAGTEQHGITSNGHLKRMMEFEPVLRGSTGIFPTIFAALRQQKPASRIAVFHDWPAFADLVEKDALDVLRHERGAARTIAAAVQYWVDSHPDLLFVHLDNVDQAGHDSGWTSSTYYQAVAQADGYVGTVLDMLGRDSATESTYVLVTSDHGGKGRGHEKNILECIQIPWILAGPDVAPGQLAAPVYTFDTAATMASIFGISLSEYAIGRPVQAAFRTSVTAARNGTPDTPGRN